MPKDPITISKLLAIVRSVVEQLKQVQGKKISNPTFAAITGVAIAQLFRVVPVTLRQSQFSIETVLTEFAKICKQCKESVAKEKQLREEFDRDLGDVPILPHDASIAMMHQYFPELSIGDPNPNVMAEVDNFLYSMVAVINSLTYPDPAKRISIVEAYGIFLGIRAKLISILHSGQAIELNQHGNPKSKITLPYDFAQGDDLMVFLEKFLREPDLLTTIDIVTLVLEEVRTLHNQGMTSRYTLRPEDFKVRIEMNGRVAIVYVPSKKTVSESGAEFAYSAPETVDKKEMPTKEANSFSVGVIIAFLFGLVNEFDCHAQQVAESLRKLSRACEKHSTLKAKRAAFVKATEIPLQKIDETISAMKQSFAGLYSADQSLMMKLEDLLDYIGEVIGGLTNPSSTERATITDAYEAFQKINQNLTALLLSSPAADVSSVATKKEETPSSKPEQLMSMDVIVPPPALPLTACSSTVFSRRDENFLPKNESASATAVSQAKAEPSLTQPHVLAVAGNS